MRTAILLALLLVTPTAIAATESKYDPAEGLPGPEWGIVETPTDGTMFIGAGENGPLTVTGNNNLATSGGLFESPTEDAVYKFRVQLNSGAFEIGLNGAQKSMALTVAAGRVGFKGGGDAWLFEHLIDTSVMHDYRVEKHGGGAILLIVDGTAVGGVDLRSMPNVPAPFVFADTGVLFRTLEPSVIVHQGYKHLTGATSFIGEDPPSTEEEQKRQDILGELYPELGEVGVFD